MFPAFLTTLFFSLSAVTGNRCAKIFGGVEANFYRLTIATFLLGGWTLLAGTSMPGSASAMFLWSGIIGVGIGDTFFFQALPRLGSRLTILLIQCLSVPFAAAVEWIWLGTSLTLSQIGWIAVVLAGIALALAPNRARKLPANGLNIGVICAVIAALGNGFGAVLSRKAYFLAHQSQWDVDAPTAAFQRLLGGFTVGLLALAIFNGSRLRQSISSNGWSLSPELRSRWSQAWPWVIGTSLAGQTLGVTCFQWALKHHPTGVVLPVVALTPLVAIPFSQIFEGERPGAKSVLGGMIAVGGVIALLTQG